MHNIGTIIRKTFQEWQEDRIAQLAAALSYYTIFSLAPLIVIVLVFAGFVVEAETIREEIITQVSSVAGSSTATLLSEMIQSFQNTGDGTVATLISVGLLLFGATNLFFQLESALNTIWNVQVSEKNTWRSILSIIQKRALSLLFVLLIGMALIVSVVANSALSAFIAYLDTSVFGTGILLQIANILLSVTIISLILMLIYKYLPDTTIHWRDVRVGAIVTACLFTVGQLAIGYYLGRSSVTSAYGAAGSLAALLIWVFYSMQILLIGAEFTQVYAHEMGKETIGQLKKASA